MDVVGVPRLGLAMTTGGRDDLMLREGLGNGMTRRGRVGGLIRLVGLRLARRVGLHLLVVAFRVWPLGHARLVVVGLHLLVLAFRVWPLGHARLVVGRLEAADLLEGDLALAGAAAA